MRKLAFLLLLVVPFLLVSCSSRQATLAKKHTAHVETAVPLVAHTGALATKSSEPKKTPYPPQDAKSILLEGKHEPFEKMTEADYRKYCKGVVRKIDSPDILPDRRGNPYQVVKFMLVSASKRQEKRSLSCFVNANEAALEEYDILVSKLYHDKCGYIIGDQEYVTGRSYIDKEGFTGARDYSIAVNLGDSDITSKTYVLTRKHGRWRIKSIETGLG